MISKRLILVNVERSGGSKPSNNIERIGKVLWYFDLAAPVASRALNFWDLDFQSRSIFTDTAERVNNKMKLF